MTESKSNDTHPQPGSPQSETEADLASAAGKKDDKSSHDEKSRVKAGSTDGAGGGAKQSQKH